MARKKRQDDNNGTFDDDLESRGWFSGLSAMGDTFGSFGNYFWDWFKVAFWAWITLWIVGLIIFGVFKVDPVHTIRVMRWWDWKGYDYVIDNIGRKWDFYHSAGKGTWVHAFLCWVGFMMLSIPFIRFGNIQQQLRIFSLYTWRERRWNLFIYGILFGIMVFFYAFIWWIIWALIMGDNPVGQSTGWGVVCSLFAICFLWLGLYWGGRFFVFPGAISADDPNAFSKSWSLTKTHVFQIWWGFFWLMVIVWIIAWFFDLIWMWIVGGVDYSTTGVGRAGLVWWGSSYLGFMYALIMPFIYCYVGRVFKGLRECAASTK